MTDSGSRPVVSKTFLAALGIMLGALWLGAAATNAAPLHDPGVSVWAQSMLGMDSETDEGGASASTSVDSSAYPGHAYASGSYNGAVHLHADSAPDGTGSTVGDAMTAGASMATINTATHPSLAPGTLVDVEVAFSIGGSITNIGNNSYGSGSIDLNLTLSRETAGTYNLFQGYLEYSYSGGITNTGGFSTYLPTPDIGTGNPFVAVSYGDAFTQQVAIGEDFSVQILAIARSGGTHRSGFGNTANFTITPLTDGVEVVVAPAIPEPTECEDGLDNDGDGFTDFVGSDPGCAHADDLSENDPTLPCDDGADNDGDGLIDFDPVTFANPGDQYTLPAGSGDPACFNPSWFTESPQCQDGLGNDDDGKIDYDGGLSALGYVAAEPDPYCAGSPWQSRESNTCGLGAELAFLLPPLMWFWRRRSRH